MLIVLPSTFCASFTRDWSSRLSRKTVTISFGDRVGAEIVSLTTMFFSFCSLLFGTISWATMLPSTDSMPSSTQNSSKLSVSFTVWPSAFATAFVLACPLFLKMYKSALSWYSLASFKYSSTSLVGKLKIPFSQTDENGNALYSIYLSSFLYYMISKNNDIVNN